jgi:hypothetical protein
VGVRVATVLGGALVVGVALLVSGRGPTADRCVGVVEADPRRRVQRVESGGQSLRDRVAIRLGE